MERNGDRSAVQAGHGDLSDAVTKFAPLMVTMVPVGPLDGEKLVMVGVAGAMVKPLARVTVCVPVVTVTLRGAQGGSAGDDELGSDAGGV